MEMGGVTSARSYWLADDSDLESPRIIVAIGVSAGGLKAIETLFENMPTLTNMAFVVVQRSTDELRDLKERLLARTEIRIRTVTDGMVVESNTIYLSPPGRKTRIVGGRFVLSNHDPSESPPSPIDVFFRSLAQHSGKNAVAVVLSETGDDGSRGMQAIHDAEGIVIAQEPHAATSDKTAKSAESAAFVDYVLPPGAIPGAILASADCLASLNEVPPQSVDLQRTTEGLRTKVSQLETQIAELSAANERLVARYDELRLVSKVFLDATDPIIIEDFSGTILFANSEAQRAYGWSRQELLGKNIQILRPESEHAREVRWRQQCRRSEAVRNVETTRLTKDGHSCPVLLALSLLTDERGKPVGIASIARDNSSQKEADFQAREAVNRRDQFLAMLSHELRNPLGAILNATYVLDKNCTVRESCDSPCHVIQRQADQMSRLLDELLDVSRVTQNKIEIRREPVDIRLAVESALQVIRPLIADRYQTLHVDLPDYPVVVNGDLSRLQQTQINLLNNAMKYTPDGGTIWLSVEHQLEEVALRVRDTGVGIPADMIDSIFDLFVQASGTLDRSEGGMGVGLTLVHKLVELHDGHITAHSDGPGKGSEFVVRIPACSSRPEHETAPDVVHLGAQRCGKILVIEDNADSRQMLTMLLELYGYQVSAAEDGSSGLELLKNDKFELALIDIGLPGMDGYQVARTFRRDDPQSPVRLVALTGYGSSADRVAVKEAGFDGHLVKPLNRDDLTKVLENRT